MCEFFEDDQDVYRVFIRYNPYKGNNGTAGMRCFIYSYGSEQLDDPMDEESLSALLAHEMVHNWPKIENDSTSIHNWYTEGLAEYYSVMLRHRFGLTSNRRFLEQVNRKITTYYTSPLVSMSNEDVNRLTWKQAEAQSLPYSRGFVYALIVDDLIRKASNESRSLDTLVLTMLRKFRAGEQYGMDEYKCILAKELGEDVAQKIYKSMIGGSLLVPAPNSIKVPYGVRLIRSDKEQWDLGFDDASVRQQVITGLREGSRAAAAGVRNGDNIVNKVTLDEIIRGENGASLELKVEREGQELTIAFRPRSWEMTEAYSYVCDVLE